MRRHTPLALVLVLVLILIISGCTTTTITHTQNFTLTETEILTTTVTPDVWYTVSGWGGGINDYKIRTTGYGWKDDNIFEIDLTITNETTTPLLWNAESVGYYYPVIVCKDESGSVIMHTPEGFWYQDEEYYPEESRSGRLRFEGVHGHIMLEIAGNSPYYDNLNWNTELMYLAQRWR
jgi:hypothetical protein